MECLLQAGRRSFVGRLDHPHVWDGPTGRLSEITLPRNDGPAGRTGERRDSPQVLHGLYCRASAAAVPSYDPHDVILAGWSAFPSADAEWLC
jgi:hypothetical protein